MIATDLACHRHKTGEHWLAASHKKHNKPFRLIARQARSGLAAATGIQPMRSRTFFVMIFAFLPAFAHASDGCAPDRAVSEVAARKHTKLIPFNVEELEKNHPNEAWLRMIAMMQAGDQIYLVDVRDAFFHADYYVLVRDGCIINSRARSIT
jgi:hypothetical protein